ncbi:helix-turn-helix transcriptional regulator [Pseudoalteromonas xiamenensis]
MTEIIDRERPHLCVIQLLLPLIELSRQRGALPEKLLAGTKLCYQSLGEETLLISQAQFDTVIQNALKLNNTELSFVFGTYLVQTMSAYRGQLLCHSKNLQQLLRLLVLHQMECFASLTAHRLCEDNKHYYFVGFAISEPPFSVQRFYIETLASLVCGFLRWRFPMLKLELRFPFAKPEHIEQYQSHLHAEYSFGHHDFALVIDRHALQLAQIGTLSNLIPRLRIPVHRAHQFGFVQYVEWQLRRNNRLSLEDLAQILAISQATLKRKLKQHNTSLVEIKDRILRQQAIVRLELGQNTERVANALEFSDLSNFRRAFKRWTGVTPSFMKNRIG